MMGARRKPAVFGDSFALQPDPAVRDADNAQAAVKAKQQIVAGSGKDALLEPSYCREIGQ